MAPTKGISGMGHPLARWKISGPARPQQHGKCLDARAVNWQANQVAGDCEVAQPRCGEGMQPTAQAGPEDEQSRVRISTVHKKSPEGFCPPGPNNDSAYSRMPSAAKTESTADFHSSARSFRKDCSVRESSPHP